MCVFKLVLLAVAGLLYLAVAFMVRTWLYDPYERFNGGFHRFMNRVWIALFSLGWPVVLVFVVVVGGIVSGIAIARAMIQELKSKVKLKNNSNGR